MQSEERKVRQIVVELDLAAPAFGRMTLLAARTQLRAVHVTRAVATHAIVRKLLPCYLGRVTGMAVELFVLAHERPVSIAAVLKIGGLPGVVAMTLATVFAEAACVGILTLVAAGAGLGKLVVQVSAAVTVLAIQVRVAAQQRESGLLRVVELLGLPPGGRVAIGAL